MRAPHIAAAALALATVVAPAVATASATSASAAPACSTRWGSLPKADSGSSPTAALTGVRTGKHGCFDRLVVDVAGKVDGYQARYVPQVSLEGSGRAVPLKGAADLEIIVKTPIDPTSRAWPRPGGDVKAVPGYRTFRQVAYAGSFEGQTTLGLGTRARLPYRVTVVDGPGGGSRLVVDVAHTW